MNRSFKLPALCAAVIFLASCDRPSSVMKYVLDADFEFAYQTLAFQSPDSVINAAYINMDNNSYLISDFVEMTGSLKRGWTLSAKKGFETAAGVRSPYTSAGKEAGAGESRVFAVFYDGPSSLEYNDLLFTCTQVLKYSCQLGGFYINNSGAVLDFIEENPLKDGDFMKVVVSAYRNGAEVGTAEKFLIDCTTGEHKVVSDWDVFKFDIKADADAADFHIVTNIDGLPRYFCFDDFVASLDLEY